eukprot:363913-Chlamydomonas_euryale.AAC.1
MRAAITFDSWTRRPRHRRRVQKLARWGEQCCRVNIVPLGRVVQGVVQGPCALAEACPTHHARASMVIADMGP